MKLPAIRHRCYHASVLGSTALAGSLALHRMIGTFHRDVDFFTAPTNFARGKLIAEGFAPEKVVVKPNSVPDPGIARGPKLDYALFLGRLEPEKGIRALLAAWDILEEPPELVILGDGPLRPLVEQAAARNERIRFEGWVDQAAIAERVAAARFFILPSEWYEGGTPIAGLQALAGGTAVIASDVGNFSEMVEPGVNGFLFRSGDARSLADVVREAWKDPSLADTLGAGGRRTYEERYSQERNRDGLLSLYERAIGRSRSGRTRTTAGRS